MGPAGRAAHHSTTDHARLGARARKGREGRRERPGEEEVGERSSTAAFKNGVFEEGK